MHVLDDHYLFFSSRRRHTRFDCDWSSDVCSSDLLHDGREPLRRLRDAGGRGHYAGRARISGQCRSEERRVGKEGRSWGWADYLKKNRKLILITCQVTQSLRSMSTRVELTSMI